CTDAEFSRFSYFAISFFFFFQAEDGIRDRTVTGVQTCALPILPGRDLRGRADKHTVDAEHLRVDGRRAAGVDREVERGRDAACRSEERRVGKECRSRWWAYQ